VQPHVHGSRPPPLQAGDLLSEARQLAAIILIRLPADPARCPARMRAYLSRLSHRLTGRHQTRADGLDFQWILTCGYGCWRTGWTNGIDLRIKGKRSCDAGRCQRAVFGIGHDLSQMLTTLEAFWRAGWSSLLGGKVLASDLPSTLPPHRPRPNGAPRPPARARTRKITFELWLRTVGSWTQARQQPPD
jgi:hypothetical protein